MPHVHILNLKSFSIFLDLLDAGKLKGMIDSLQGVLSKRCDQEGIFIIIIIIYYLFLFFFTVKELVLMVFLNKWQTTTWHLITNHFS